MRAQRLLLGAVALLMTGCFGQGDASVWGGDEAPGAYDPGKHPTHAPDGRELEPFSPAPLRLRLLLSWQYRNAVTDLLGAAAGAAVVPPPDAAVNGLEAIGAAQLALSPLSLESYEKSAFAAAETLEDAAIRDPLLGCDINGAEGRACLDGFLGRFLRTAFRREVAADEHSFWMGLATEVTAAYSSPVKGLVFAVAGILQSPHFLYLVEVGAPDPTTPGWLKLSGYELASRLALFILGSTPPPELLDAAAAGALATPEGIREQTMLLLERPEARRTLREIFSELLALRKLDSVAKESGVFPEFTPALARSMREETLRLIDALVWQDDGDFRQLFNANYTWVDASLAQLYGLDAPQAGEGDFVRRELPSPLLRAGFLGQASFLSINAHPVTTSPTFRGKFIREHLLCEPISAPPPEVDTSIPTDETAGKTTRERMERHASDPSCSGCHVLMDPMGLGLENFDAIGRFRNTENGHPVVGTGDFDQHGEFEGAAELGGLIASDPRVASCLARTLFRHATGHVDLPSEEAPLVMVDASFVTQGFRLRALLAEIAASDAFRFAAPSDSGSTP